MYMLLRPISNKDEGCFAHAAEGELDLGPRRAIFLDISGTRM